jgi:periplasmic protein TonB
MNNTVKWTGAIVLSLLAHAGAAKLFEPGEKPREQALVAGGEAMEVAVLGNAFEEMIQAGDPTEAVEPEEVEPEEVEPTPVEVADVLPIQSEITAETPSDIVPTEADVILPAEEISPIVAEQPEVTATVAPAETVVPEEKPEIVKPEPERRPDAKKEPEKVKPPKKKPFKKRAGDAGKSEASQRKGQADGAENAAANTATGKKGAASQQSGNANLSNLDGKVRSKLNRAFRYPPQAERERLRGIAQVQFTLSANGSVSNVRIAKSAGSPILDQAVLDAVRRASPFPRIPEAAGVSSRTFTVPMHFNR